MTREDLSLSGRYVRMRLLESFLAVVGTTLGVAIISVVVTLVHSYNVQAAQAAGQPEMRSITAVARGHEGELPTPIQLIRSADQAQPDLQIADIVAAKEACPDVDFGFMEDRRVMVTGTAAAGYFQQKTAGAGPAAGGGAVVGTTGGPRAKAEASVAIAGGASSVAAAPPDAGGPSVTMGAEGSNKMLGTGPAGGENKLVPFPGEPQESLEPVLVSDIEVARVTPDYFPMYGLEVAEGSLFTLDDADQGTPVVVVGSSLATRLFADGKALGKRMRLSGITMTIIGVLAPDPWPSGPGTFRRGNDYRAFVPYNIDKARLLGATGGKMVVMVSIGGPSTTLTFGVRDPARIDLAVKELETYFAQKYGPERISISSMAAEARIERRNHNRLFVVFGFLAGTALLISAINLFNLMTTRAIRRQRSIGILRAIGAARDDIFTVYLGESLVLSGIGGVAGALLGAGLVFVSRLLPAAWGLGGTLDLPVLAICLLGGVAVNVLSGVLPALQAARTSIVDSIRFE